MLAFVAVTVATQIAKSFITVEEKTFSDGKHIVVFHAKVRCPTCLAMERLTEETLSSEFDDEVQSGILNYHALSYESPEWRRLVEKYKIATATVLLFEQKDGDFLNGRNLVDDCWRLVGDKPAFKEMLKNQVSGFLREEDSEWESESEEIELSPDLDLFEE